MEFSYKISIFVALVQISISFTSSVNITSVGVGVAQIIDHLSENYQMKFTIVLAEKKNWSNDLVKKIVSHSNSVIGIKYSAVIGEPSFIDFDESYILIHECRNILPSTYARTNSASFKHKLTLSFSLDNTEEVMNEKPTEHITHDFYQIAHSPKNGSMWLMSAELFFNKTCKGIYHPINFFNSSSMKWSIKKFFNQYKTFNNCSAFIGIDDIIDNIDRLRQIHEKRMMFLDSILTIFSQKYKIRFKDIFVIAQMMYKRRHAGTDQSLVDRSSSEDKAILRDMKTR